MPKTALIVDDSKTARVVLKRMLETHALNVDTAESAEDALEYLNDHRPDVVFMDHLMPGMDGFEAVTAIKNNPETATIPIMMYTSQKGELYVGQARALGAIGVLPKEVEPVEVSKVLQSLRVIGGDVERAGQGAAVQQAPMADPADLQHLDRNLRELIQDLFEQQREVLRRDLLDSYEAIASRVADEIRPPDTDVTPADTGVPVPGRPNRAQIAIAVLALVVVVLGLFYWQREQSLREVLQQNAELVRALELQQSLGTQDALEAQRRLDIYERTLGSAFESALDALEWGVNQSSRYAFGDIPFGDVRREIFEDMSARLLAMGFSGQVRVESHVGDFCMVSGSDGFVAAATDMAASQCDAIGFGATEAYQSGLRQSVAFADFVNRSTEQTSGRIRYELVSLGNTQPLAPYPNSLTGVTAGGWNDIAATNNRVVVSLYPD